MTVFSFHTIANPGQGLYKEKSSKFLSFAIPVDSETEIRERLESLRKQYFDARHHCFAWTLGPEKKLYRAYDDGEPNHSAGDPILGQIRSRNLTNVLVVVVRYFGGTKLGVGGLVSAYRSAAEQALEMAGIKEVEIQENLSLRYRYEDTPVVMRLIKEFDLAINDQQFGETCEISVQVARRKFAKFLEKIKLLQLTGTPVQLDIGT